MSEHTLLDMVGQIDEAYIDEAAHPEIALGLRKKRSRATILRQFGTVAACVVIVAGLAVAIPYIGMGGSKTAEDANSTNIVVNGFHYSADESDTVVAEQISPSKAETTQDEDNKTTTGAAQEAPQVVTADIVHQTEQIDGVVFVYESNCLISFHPAQEQTLTEITIPNSVMKIDDEFWKAVAADRQLQIIHIHGGVADFGDISPLHGEIVIICPEGSVADSFFTNKGYHVQYES